MTRLQRATQTPRSGNVLAILSALPAEGKSVLASNLALAYAASGIKVLLVDADPYEMSVTRAFELKRPGLNEVLEGRAKLATALSLESRSGLHLLGAREPSAPARGPADNGAMAGLLRELRDQFELVIVDCPAILPLDGGVFVEHADRIAFVIAWETTDRAAVEQAFRLLGSHVAKLAGVILNKASPRWYGAFDDGRYLRYVSPPANPIAPAAPAAPAPATARVAVFTRRAAP